VFKRLTLSLLLAAPPLLALAAPDSYRLDPVHTRVLFAVEHAGFSHALGTVSGSEGVLVFDPEDWRTARLEVSVPIQRLDLGDPKWNTATLARNLLDGERFPQARFVSTHVEPIDPTHANVTGQLTVRGGDPRGHAGRHPQCAQAPSTAAVPPYRRLLGHRHAQPQCLRRGWLGLDDRR